MRANESEMCVACADTTYESNPFLSVCYTANLEKYDYACFKRKICESRLRTDAEERECMSMRNEDKNSADAASTFPVEDDWICLAEEYRDLLDRMKYRAQNYISAFGSRIRSEQVLLCTPESEANIEAHLNRKQT